MLVLCIKQIVVVPYINPANPAPELQTGHTPRGHIYIYIERERERERERDRERERERAI